MTEEKTLEQQRDEVLGVLARDELQLNDTKTLLLNHYGNFLPKLIKRIKELAKKNNTDLDDVLGDELIEQKDKIDELQDSYLQLLNAVHTQNNKCVFLNNIINNANARAKKPQQDENTL